MFLQVIFICISLFNCTNKLHASAKEPSIQNIYVDPALFLKINDLRMAMAIGATAITKFLATNWKKPTEEDLYEPLKSASAKSTIQTFKNGQALPLILSDWLTQKSDAEELEDTMNRHLNLHSKTKKGTAHGTIIRNAVSALINPEKCIALHDLLPKNILLFKQLAKQGYRIYLAGNFAYPKILQEKYSEHLGFIEEWHLSGETGLLKPSPDFFSIIKQDPSECLFIETEAQHCLTDLRNILLPDPTNSESLLVELKKNGITLDE